MRLFPTLAALTLTAALVTGCGSSDSDKDDKRSSSSSSSASPSASESASDSPSPSADASGDYCAELKADKAYFEAFSGSDPNQLDKAFARFHVLATKAPDDVADDWKVIDGAITTVQTTLKSAGISLADLAKVTKTGKVPQGVDPQKLQQVASKLQALNGPQFQKAGDAITKHAKTECKVDLG